MATSRARKPSRPKPKAKAVDVAAPDPVDARHLTGLQARFCDEYAVDRNATQAYRRASGGQRAKNAKQRGHQLLQLSQVQARLNELTAEQAGDAKRRKELRIGGLLRVMHDPDEATANRLRAIELSGKIDGDFVEKHEFVDPAGRAERIKRARLRVVA